MAKSGLDVGYAEMKGQFPCKRGAKSPLKKTYIDQQPSILKWLFSLNGSVSGKPFI